MGLQTDQELLLGLWLAAIWLSRALFLEKEKKSSLEDLVLNFTIFVKCLYATLCKLCRLTLWKIKRKL